MIICPPLMYHWMQTIMWSFIWYFYPCFSFIYFLDLESEWIFYSLISFIPSSPCEMKFVIQLA